MISRCHTLSSRQSLAARPARIGSTPRRLPVPSPPTTRASAAGGELPPSAVAPRYTGGEAVAPRYTTRLQHMDTITLHPFHDLDQAESELNAYCTHLSPEEETEKCWQAYSFLESKREKAKEGCDLENPKDCEDLERLNTMAHDLLATGSMDDLVATFSTLARVEEHRAARAAKQAEQPAQPKSAAAPGGADVVHLLFQRMDANGDGRLSVGEFRSGMDLLGQHVDGATMALIGDAMDLHDGFLTEQQFRDILEAESIVSHNQIVEMWRHHRQDRPSWWTSAPKGMLRM